MLWSFRPRVQRKFAVLALVLVTCQPLFAQSQQPLTLQRLTAPVTIDGVPGEAAWRQITPLPLTMYSPVFRGTPTQRTEIRVAYDDEYFYAAGWFYDTDPSGIRINSLYRDRWNGDDAFAIYIDAFNDNQNAKWFGTTPGGIRFDQLVSDDGLTLNGSWDTFWNARTTSRSIWTAFRSSIPSGHARCGQGDAGLWRGRVRPWLAYLQAARGQAARPIREDKEAQEVGHDVHHQHARRQVSAERGRVR